MLATPNPRDAKTRQAVKTFVASTGYELASGSTLHQVHDVTAQDDPEVIQDLDDDVNVDKDDEIDDEIAYLGTSQPGQLGIHRSKALRNGTIFGNGSWIQFLPDMA